MKRAVLLIIALAMLMGLVQIILYSSGYHHHLDKVVTVPTP